ncbi:ornithine cyclodeaminase family protein [Cloacibacillus sp. An23]|uniref:ornithine cyclodeaminase family protein n=1 Tax=Cloacibacillus sp. An23 TaxID=1965591 RepID=UPI000B37D3E6|nr:ornithine cyclodeaminase family protein [Cloacibacillus sp. An23]OUO94400.1 ornithine cyclodeaminase [Cloacibacillus sp. An23]
MDILYLNSRDIETLALTNDEILGAVEESLRAQGNGETSIEPRVHIHPEEKYHGHFNVLRGYISPKHAVGVKIVGDYVYNYKLGLPSEMSMLNLFSPETGAPYAVIDATAITSMRTGAITAIGAKYLAKKKNKVLGHLGCRGTAFWNVVLLDHLYDFDEIRINSRRRESMEAFAEALEARLHKKITIAKDSEECLKGADIMVEATRLTEPQPLLKTEWVRPGNFVVPYGTICANEITLTDVMDKIVVDDWGQCKEGGKLGSLSPHVRAGKLTEKTLYAELGEIVAGKKPGRENDDEKILFWHRGLSINDIALGQLYYEKALANGVGTKLFYR